MKPLSQEQFEAIRDWLSPYIPKLMDDFEAKFNPEQPTLLPFDLEEALANHDRVVYRDGSKPLEWHLHAKIDSPWSITCVAENQIMVHRNDGTYHATIGRESKLDLCLLPELKKEYWVNLYNDKQGNLSFGSIYCTEEQAIKNRIHNRKNIKTISFTI